MSDDKYIGIEVLSNTVNSMTEMIDDRNGLLNSMFKKDVYNDFLMSEAAQGGVGGAGVDNQAISSMGGGAPDLSNPMMSGTAGDDGGSVSARDSIGSGNIGGASDNGASNPTTNYKAGGVSTTPSTSSSKVRSSGLSSGDKSSTKSLEETGFNDTVEKNISNKLEEDFKIDPRLKKAFGDSLALPMKAAAAGLMGLLSKIPAISPSLVTNVGNFMTSVGSSLGLFSTASVDNSTQQSTENQGGNNLWSQIGAALGLGKKEEGKETPTKTFGSGLRGMNSEKGKGLPGAGQGGPSVVSTVKNFFGLAKDKDHQVDPSTIMGGVVNNLQKRRMMIEMFGDQSMGGGMNQGGTMGGMMNIMNDLSSSMQSMQTSGSFNEISKNLVTNMSGVANSSSTKSMITDLTNTVINEGNALASESGGVEGIKEQMSGIIQKARQQMPNFDMESGGSMAISKVKDSPFFTEYANTAQFT